jgi:anti-sigma B factor antagonist
LNSQPAGEACAFSPAVRSGSPLAKGGAVRTADGDKISLDGSGFGMATSGDGDGHVVLHVAGELDAATAPQLKEALFGLIDGREASVLDVDLTELDFIDSTGLGVLVGARQLIRSDGGELRLCNPRPNIAKVLEITGLSKAFPLGPSGR